MNSYQHNALRFYCRLACETVHPRFSYLVADRASIVLTPEAAWLKAIETVYRQAQAHKGAALVERAIWDRHMRGRAN